MYANIVAMISESSCKNLSLQIRGEIDGLIINSRCISMDAVSSASEAGNANLHGGGRSCGDLRSFGGKQESTSSVNDAAEVIEILKNGAILSV